MKRISFSLNRVQLIVWHNCIETLWMEPGVDSPHIVKMVHHALTSLLHKLKSESIIIKNEYRFSIDSVVALAFVAHIKMYTHYLLDGEDVALINQIVGIIDHKTK